MMKKLRDILYVAGGIVMILGACLYVTRWSAAPYVYLVGAVLFAAMQITDTYKGSSFVVKRLRRQQIIGAVLLVVAGILMLVLHRNEWMVCLLVAAIFELYTAFRIPKELERDNQ